MSLRAFNLLVLTGHYTRKQIYETPVNIAIEIMYKMTTWYFT